ncbi:hypothetical protein Cp1R7AA1_139 [Mesorhizobium phage Cp1R7A-A1]|nr:hypothetical protein Cp1R7AA1_139 [Mesorhizobium phage Cp1R7A-A1]
MYLRVSTADTKGQFTEGFAIEVKHFRFHGLTNGGLLVDFVHADDTKERVLLGMELYGDFKLGTCPERIVELAIVEFAWPVLTKDEYHARVGKGMFLDPQRGHFVAAS